MCRMLNLAASKRSTFLLKHKCKCYCNIIKYVHEEFYGKYSPDIILDMKYTIFILVGESLVLAKYLIYLIHMCDKILQNLVKKS